MIGGKSTLTERGGLCLLLSQGKHIEEEGQADEGSRNEAGRRSVGRVGRSVRGAGRDKEKGV